MGERFKLLTLGAFLVGVFAVSLGLGLMFLDGKNQQSDDIKIISADSSSEIQDKIVVQVDGAVVSPGVYEVDANLRVGDVVDVAKGLTNKADMEKVNLAAKISDGQKIHIPEIGEGATSGGEVAGTSLISINNASESQLDTLPGVGPVTAQKIVKSRPYKSLEELVSKKAVGSATFSKIRDLITL